MSEHRTLVTGAGGFIGSSVSRLLEERGHRVRRATHRPEPGSHVAVEVGPETDWSEALADVDSVVHLAARAHVLSDRSTDPLSAFRRVNVAGTTTLARAAAEAGVERFVFVSSAGVHGRTADVLITEASKPAPVSLYAQSKLEAEAGLHEFNDDLEVVILRPPLVYGPGAPGNFARLVAAVQRGLPIPLGAATSRRSFAYVENLSDAIVTCLGEAEASGETFLVSDGDDLTAAELVARLAAAMKLSPRLVAVPERLMRFGGRLAGRSEDVDRLFGSFQLDITKLRRTLGWAPPVAVEEGLRRTVAEFGRVDP